MWKVTLANNVYFKQLEYFFLCKFPENPFLMNPYFSIAFKHLPGSLLPFKMFCKEILQVSSNEKSTRSSKDRPFTPLGMKMILEKNETIELRKTSLQSKIPAQQRARDK